jgi:peptide chain release factor 3
VFKPAIGSQWIVGVVGQLQLDVLASRMAGEYGLEVAFEPPPFELARWIAADDQAELKKFVAEHQGNMAEDRDGAPVFLAKSAWELRYTGEKRPAIRFAKTRERQAAAA